MYSKEEATKLRQQFWIAFGKYMKPIPSAEGLTINWINYKTGVKQLYFKMNVDQKSATIAIEITHNDEYSRNLFFEQFKALKNLFNNNFNEEWRWEQNVSDQNGVVIAKISTDLNGVSIFNQQSWPQIISFFKPRIISLDQFWTDVKPIFEEL